MANTKANTENEATEVAETIDTTVVSDTDANATENQNTSEATETKSKFLNPFEPGVSYDDFLAAVKKSKKSVAEYCKGNLSEEDLAWLEKDLGMYKK